MMISIFPASPVSSLVPESGTTTMFMRKSAFSFMVA
jgi:hypothetical protein